MKIYICFFLFLASLSVHAQVGVIDYDRKMMHNLNIASEWLIEEGVYTFHNGGKEQIFRKLVDDWGVQLWVDPWIESDRYINGFWIKARLIHQDVLNFHRETVGNDIYEFWVVNVHTPDSSVLEDHAKFYITKTDSIAGIRSIVLKSTQFIDKYSVGDSVTLFFPTDNLQILYELNAWRYPSSYKFTDIDDKKVDAIGRGLYEFVD